MDKHDESIKEIIERINKNNSEDTSKLPETYEFETGDTSFVLEFGKSEDPSDVTEDTDRSSQIKKNDGESSKSDLETPPATVTEVSKKEEDPMVIGTPAGIFTAYVPRFTEISDNYRMVDDPRPKKGQKTSESRTVIAEDITEDASASEDYEKKVDPTAELEEKSSDAVIVKTSQSSIADEDAEKLSVFKFSEGDSSTQEKKEPTLEEESAAIARLILGDKKTPPAEETAVRQDTSEEVKEEIKTADTKKEYTLPDPDSGISVIDFDEKDDNGSRNSDISSKYVPEGVSEYVPDKKKNSVKEFELPIQRDRIKDKFLDAIMATRIRFGTVLLFALVILGFEIASFYDVFDISGLSVFSAPATPVIIDMLLSASVFLLALPETLNSVKALFKKKLVSDISVPMAFLVLACYGAIIVFIKKSNYPLYGFLFSVFAVFSVYATLCKLNADFAAFKLISGNGEKQILEKKITRELAEENYALDGLVDEYKSRTARIFRASFITDFYKRTTRVSEKSSHSVLLLSITIGLSVMISLICYFLRDGLYSASSAFAIVFTLGFPAFSVISHKLTYKNAQEYAVSEDSAALGETEFSDFSEVDVICFEDSEIFGIDDVNLKRFMLYGNRDNMEPVMRMMCSLFSVVGGPLYSIFTNALENRVRHNPAVNTVIEEDGLCGEVNGKTISAGSEEYMRRHGIAIPEGASQAERKNDTIKIMYAAEGKEVYAKFYIRYSFSEEFTRLLPSLKERGIVPLIYTSDPNISNELLKRLSAGADCMRVMKRLSPGTTDEKLYNRVSAGMVTVGDKINAINLVLLSGKYKRFSDRISSSEIVSMSVGIGIGALLSLLGLFNDLPTAFFGLWHILWYAVLAFSAGRKFLKENKISEKNDETN